MMGFGEFMSKFGSVFSSERETIPESVTTDKVLLDLRRKRQLQMESKEKERLKRNIGEFAKREQAKNLFGITNPNAGKDLGFIQASKKVKKVSKPTFLQSGTMMGKSSYLQPNKNRRF